MFTLDVLDKLRDQHKQNPDFAIDWAVTPDDVGMGVAKRIQEIPASTFQSVNPICILALGLVFTGLWSFLAQRGWEPSTTVKFAIGLLQLSFQQHRVARQRQSIPMEEDFRIDGTSAEFLYGQPILDTCIFASTTNIKNILVSPDKELGSPPRM